MTREEVPGKLLPIDHTRVWTQFGLTIIATIITVTRCLMMGIGS